MMKRKCSITGVVYDSNMRPAGLATFAAAGPDLTGFSSYEATTEEAEAPGWVTGNRTEKKRQRRRSSLALRQSFIEAVSESHSVRGGGHGRPLCGRSRGTP
eukprot:GHVU01202877.1.p4 GENE.GHVU01202877.1~~GHVU01202877.1.p4  ORF type:complete len:101 (+),score=11.31 GHVU01202877.1:340-642(+)